MTEYKRIYRMAIMLVADHPDHLPDHEDAEQLVWDQMSGELNEETGLFCGMVEILSFRDDPVRFYKVDPRGVVELANDDPAATVCGYCGRAWDDTVSTAVTPTPAGRCPFEHEHSDEEDEAMTEDL